MAYAGAPRTPGPDASHSCSFRMGASPRSSSPNTVGFFSMSSASGKFVGPSLKFGGKRQEAICAVARKARQRMRVAAQRTPFRELLALRVRCVGVSRSRVAAGSTSSLSALLLSQRQLRRVAARALVQPC